MLAADPGASIASIAGEAGVDRRTVYRRFASREELLAAIYEGPPGGHRARHRSHARLREAPVAVALHRYVENIIARQPHVARRPDPHARRRHGPRDAGTRRAAKSTPFSGAPPTKACSAPTHRRGGPGRCCPDS